MMGTLVAQFPLYQEALKHFHERPEWHERFSMEIAEKASQYARVLLLSEQIGVPQ